jgi:hypothetical protein
MKPFARKVNGPGVRIFALREERGGPAVAPRYAKVACDCPSHVQTADRLDPDKLFRSFSACLDRITNIGCQPTLYSKCGLCWSVDECRTWLRAREAIPNDVDAPAFIAAVLVQGDVNYCPTTAPSEMCGNFSLAAHGGKRRPMLGKSCWRPATPSCAGSAFAADSRSAGGANASRILVLVVQLQKKTR